MSKLYLFNEDRTLGSSTLWLRKNVRDHILLAVPRLRLEHSTMVSFVQGASLLSVFRDAQCMLDGQVHAAIVLSGTPELFRRSTPTMADMILYLRGESQSPGLAFVLSAGMAMLRA